ncbi:hypothetical protein [Brochothrix thermosphacta]|uniref:hypothetical protein n=1 Tax=Brochothrix thermosphacta TaxID=2756 RepID=UPI0004920358|nr:hypothetical protein [Brochothrix thermosphacta]ODJ49218.1 hypothetical protein BFR34_06160 [Brochothrix thermosphacta DSM 20171 = FSL F6-1036]
MTLSEDKAKKTALILKINNLIDKHRRENRRKVFGTEETVEVGVKLACGCDTCSEIEKLGNELSELRTRKEEDRIVKKSYTYTVSKKGEKTKIYKTIKSLSKHLDFEIGMIESRFRRCVNNEVEVNDFVIKRKVIAKSYKYKKKAKESDLLRSSILEKEAYL